MPRQTRAYLEDQVVHVLNRGNQRQQIFHHQGDYQDFVHILARLKRENAEQVQLYAFCLMPNHFHAVLYARRAKDLGTFMTRWQTSFIVRHHAVHGTSGHLFQGRYRAFPIQRDHHLETVLKYVLRNPVAAGLCDHAGAWRWSSYHYPELVDGWPIPEPRNVRWWLEQELETEAGEGVARSIAKSTAFGSGAPASAAGDGASAGWDSTGE